LTLSCLPLPLVEHAAEMRGLTLYLLRPLDRLACGMLFFLLAARD
jgi:hypothetical protein